MGEPSPLPLDLPAGVVKREGQLAASGRYIDADWVRFFKSKPQKIGGWFKLTTSTFLGYARALHAWNDLTANTWIAIGTTEALYGVDINYAPVDITPVTNASPYALTNVFTTTNGSSVVTVTHTAHGAVAGQRVVFSATSAPVGGLTMDGTWTITSITDANHYTFTHSGVASSGAGPAANTTANYLLPPGTVDPSQGFGYGVGTYGSSTYGTARSVSLGLFEPYYWCLDNFGKLLLAAPFGGPLYSFDPTTLPWIRAARAAVADGPGAMRCMFVTPERFVMALGASPDTTTGLDNLLVRWPSQNTLDQWTPSSANTANSRRLTSGKKIMGGGALGSGVSLIWTDTSLYVHQYTGSRFVFDTRLVGTSCGLYGPHAFTFAQGRAFWIGSSGFHIYAGSVDVIPNSADVSDWVFNQLAQYFETKIVAFFNQRYNEVWWLFVPTGSTEPVAYVAVSLTDFSWVNGLLARTAHTRIDGADTRPILASTDGYLYTHEYGADADGAAKSWYLQTAPFQMGDGANDLNCLGVIPDFGYQTGDITMLIQGYDRQQLAPSDTGTLTLVDNGGKTDARVCGRLFDYKLSQSVVGGDFRLGKLIADISTGGSRS